RAGLLAPLGSRPAAYAQSVRRHAPLEVRYSVRIDDYVSSFHSRFLFLDPSILPCRLLPTSTSWVIPSKVPMSTWRPALWLQTITTSAETKRLGFTFGGKRSARAWRSSVQSSGITVASAPMRCCRPVRFLNRTRLLAVLLSWTRPLSSVPPNKRLKLPGGDCPKGSRVLCAGAHELSFNYSAPCGQVARSLGASR